LHANVELPEASTVALLDAAIYLARLVDGSNPQPMFPVGVESIRFDTELADEHGSVEVYRRGGNDDELIVDIAVKAPDGSTCIDIRALRYAAVESGPVPTSPRDDPGTLAHAIAWQPWDEHADAHVGSQQVPAENRAPCTVAVIGADHAARTLRDRLASTGYLPADVTEARSVLYIAEPGPVETAETDIDCAVRVSADVADLVRRLAERDDDHPATLWIITRGVREGISDAAVRQSCLWGIAGVIRAEQPQLWGGLVDIEAGPDLDEDIADCASALSAVLQTPAKSILTLRGGEFLAPTLVPVGGQPVREPFRCRADAAYLITGGMGALGLLMAAWLADRGARRLVLAGRTPLPPRHDWDSDTIDTAVRHKIAAIRALEMRGVSVDAVALDVGSRDALLYLLAGRDNEGAPPIRGVIHAAGVNEGQLLTEISDDRLRRTMWPKIVGAQVLHEAFPPGSIDFLYLTASAGAVFGVPGQGAYASANAYLDGLARARHRQGCNTVSLDWVAWQGLGFAADAHVVLHELERLGSRPLSPNEAFTAWEHVARYEVAQAVIAPLPSSDGSASDAPDTYDTSLAKATWSQLPAEKVLSELENGLRTILARELQIPEPEFELDRPFAELGLNSVMAMSIRREAERFVGIELSATMLWNHPTITSLAEHLAKKLVPQDDSDDGVDVLSGSASSVLDELFDSIEAPTASVESGIR
jgi:phthiocerol/phenolphthiocerol synthesis type-I polyketide synthase A